MGPLLKPALHILATAVLGVLLAGALIRMAPGFGIDEREFDLRLNDDSVRRIRAEATEEVLFRTPRNPVIIDVRVWAE